MSSLEIREVRSKEDRLRFVQLHYDLYRGNSYWCPPLLRSEMKTYDPDMNPAFRSADTAFWLALKDGKTVGRLAGIISYPYNAKRKISAARFGFPDFIDDPDVSRLLFTTFEDWAAARGMTRLSGPLGFTSMDHQGLLVEGFEELSTMNVLYNHPYYLKHIEAMGYIKDIDWVEYKIFPPEKEIDIIGKMAARTGKALGLRSLYGQKKKDLLAYAEKIFSSLEASYDALYTHVPLSREQISYYIRENIPFIPAKFLSVIVDEQDEVAAFGITMPSLTRALQKCEGRIFPFGWIHLRRAFSHFDIADLLLIGVRPDLQGKGVNAMVFNDLMPFFLRQGIRWAESNPELESNDKVQNQWKFFHREQHKRRRLLKKDLPSDGH